MVGYVGRRLLQVIPVLIGVSLVVFVAMHILPGDVARMIAGEKATEESLAAIRHQLGLDRPLWEQYGMFLAGVLRGDFGTSLRTHNPAWQEVMRAFPVTIQLALASLTMAVVVGIAVGIISAVRRGTWVDTIAMLVALFGVSMPVFWTGLMLMLLFGRYWPVLPVSGLIDSQFTLSRITGIPVMDAILSGDWQLIWSSLRHLVLPAITLATVPIAMIARMTRSSILEVLNQDYIRTARAKGVSERWVLLRHAFKPGLIPVVTVIGLQMGLLLSGAILTETIFGLPGLGQLAVVSILYRDYTVTQALALLTAVIYVLINLVVDLVYAWMDPRIRYS